MSEDIVPQKRCTKCGTTYPATTQYFHKGKKSNTLRAMCRNCHREYLNPDARNRLPLLPEAPEGFKCCSQCQRVLPLSTDNFANAPRYKHGLSSECRDCMNNRSREYQTLERRKAGVSEFIPAKLRETKTCPACKNTYPRTNEYFGHSNRYGIAPYCRECEKERGRKKNRVLRSNPERRDELNKREREREYRRYHSDEKVRTAKKTKTLLRRSRKSKLPVKLTSKDWQRCLDYFNYSCAICGRPRGFWHTLAQDHWISLTDPRPDNPGTVPWNIVPLCHGDGGCNNIKWKKDPEQWLITHYGKRKAAKILKRIQDYFEHIKQQ